VWSIASFDRVTPDGEVIPAGSVFSEIDDAKR